LFSFDAIKKQIFNSSTFRIILKLLNFRVRIFFLDKIIQNNNIITLISALWFINSDSPNNLIARCTQFFTLEVDTKVKKKISHLVSPFEDVALSIPEPLVQINKLGDSVFADVVGKRLRLLPGEWTSFGQQAHFGPILLSQRCRLSVCGLAGRLNVDSHAPEREPVLVKAQVCDGAINQPAERLTQCMARSVLPLIKVACDLSTALRNQRKTPPPRSRVNFFARCSLSSTRNQHQLIAVDQTWLPTKLKHTHCRWSGEH
jgi:hypothetical protein